MSLEQTIRSRSIEALKNKNEVAKTILRVVLGEIDVLKGRGTVVEDEQVVKIIRKVILSNEETMKVKPSETLQTENQILSEFLPQLLTQEQSEQFLVGSKDAIMAAKSDGQATGVAMGLLKKNNCAVDGKDVTEVVKKLRA